MFVGSEEIALGFVGQQVIDEFLRHPHQLLLLLLLCRWRCAAAFRSGTSNNAAAAVEPPLSGSPPWLLLTSQTLLIDRVSLKTYLCRSVYSLARIGRGSLIRLRWYQTTSPLSQTRQVQAQLWPGLSLAPYFASYPSSSLVYKFCNP